MAKWKNIEDAPWDGEEHLLTDGEHRWVSSRWRGITKNADHDFDIPRHCDFPTMYCALPRIPKNAKR